MHICLEHEFYLCQGFKTITQLFLPPVVVNKVLQEYSPVPSFKGCLWLLSHYNGRNEFLRPAKTICGPQSLKYLLYFIEKVC